MALPRATDVEVIGTGGSGGVTIGESASELVSFYGKAPVAQRAYSSAVHATSALASSTDFGATQLAAVQEIQKTLIALGVWATA
jgi:hypothetical protein